MEFAFVLIFTFLNTHDRVQKVFERSTFLVLCCQNHGEVVSFSKLGKSSLLFDEDLAPSVEEIVLHNVLLHDLSNFRVVVNQGHPVLLSDRITMELGQSSVNELRSLTESATIRSNNACVVLLDAVLLELVDLIADHERSFRHKLNFVVLIKLVNENCVLLVVSWLKLREKFNHELFV